MKQNGGKHEAAPRSSRGENIGRQLYYMVVYQLSHQINKIYGAAKELSWNAEGGGEEGEGLS